MSQFRFELESVSGLLERTQIVEPVGWDTNRPTLTRDEVYHGAIRSFTVDLTFIKDGYQYLKQLYDTEGVLSECLVYIYEHNNSTHEYVLQDVGKIDFTEWNETITSGKGVTLTITDTAFAEKIRAREDVEINYNDNVDLDDNPMSEPVYVDQEILGMDVISEGTLETVEQTIKFSAFESGYDYGYFWIPGVTASGQIPGLKSVIAKFVQFTTAEDIDFYVAENDGELIIDGKLLYDFLVENAPGSNNTVSAVWVKADGSPTEFLARNVYDNNTVNLNQELDISGTYQLKEGDRIFLSTRALTDAGGEPNASQLYIKPATINFTQKDKALPTNSKGAFLFDAFNRTIESITGVTDSLFSNVLDNGGEFHDYTVQNGFLIRNYTPEQSAMSWKFKDLFQNNEKIFNLGLAINSDNTVEIRKKIDFFQDGVILTIGKDRIEADSFEKSIDTEYFFSDIEIGYAKSAYEEISGLEEYNNQSFFNTILSVLNNKLDAVSKIRGDGYGIEFARRKQKEDDVTEDTKYDKDLFMLNVIDDEGYKQLTTEGFSSITGIEQIETPANLNITPAQNLRRWGWMLSAGLQKYTDSLIKFNKSDFESDLSTTKDGLTVAESANVPYSELEAPVFTGHKIIFTAPLTFDELNILKASPYQIVKVWNPIDEEFNFGWIREVGIEAADKATNWELIEAKSVTEVLKFILLNDGGAILLNDGSGLLLNDQG